MELLKYKTEIISRIINSNEVIVYGAGTMGTAVRKCITDAPYNLSVKCFIVKNMEDNAYSVDELPVIDTAHASTYKDSTILIALNSKFIPEVVNDLTEAGFTNLIPISFDGDEWSTIRGNWMRFHGIIPAGIIYLSDVSSENYKLNNIPSISDYFHIYVAHSIYDKNLIENTVDKPYEISIQVGAALTDQIMYDVRDCIGDDNISDRNRQYCELTGIYWAWKNDTADYIGFSHYRRKFVLTSEQFNAILTENIDIIVTEPIVNFATVRGQYAKDHIAKDWDIFIDVIGELAPEYLSAAELIQDSIYYYAYNMFIMKKDIFDEYCNFIFPILERCEELIGLKEDIYQNRYVGFLAERLLSIFIAKNLKYTIAIADKHFIE
ncbi:DUF4422 domain-containing protein [Oribacterium sp. WCC10]|uniref:DUF4422 domain-containing protein n=1 Tax=Oribacterium sp. WCC10 TaxID=1855343 RepID=UPI0008E72F25|nr:DUF4422 domain-containing protein [Oribacterium sp. WCC10]SFG25421.1 protein of unknown function [Oribacterium sp. WCC10]